MRSEYEKLEAMTEEEWAYFKPTNSLEETFVLEHSRRLVASIVLKYWNLPMSQEDLTQEAYLALIKACRTYDPTKSKRSSYIVTAITSQLNSIARALGAQCRSATTLSLETGGIDGNGNCRSLMDDDLSKYDTLHAPETPLCQQVAQRIYFERVMQILRDEGTPEQRRIIEDFMKGVSQEKTAAALNFGQPKVSKKFRETIAWLRARMIAMGYMDEDDTFEDLV